MSHHVAGGEYERLVHRLNLAPQGAPPSELLYEILAMLFRPDEARKVARLPVRPFDLARACQAWRCSESEALANLDVLADKGLLLDYTWKGSRRWVLPPPMAGFFEFSMMRVRDDIDQKLLSELFYEYLNVEDAFVLNLFGRGETQLGRVFVPEDLLRRDHLEVLDWQRASSCIESAHTIAIGVCYCRHKMTHLGKACDAPLDVCMTLNNTASSLVKHGLARKVGSEEALEVLVACRERGLVQFGENVRQSVNFICHCCGCCCEGLLAARRLGFHHPILASAWMPVLDGERCRSCGRCEELCPIGSLKLVEGPGEGERLPHVDTSSCLGCGVCVRSCPREALHLEFSPEKRVLPPYNATHRTVMMAVERGMLGSLFFDDPVRSSHRALAALVDGILALPPVKRVMASEQVKSRFLGALVERLGY